MQSFWKMRNFLLIVLLALGALKSSVGNKNGANEPSNNNNNNSYGRRGKKRKRKCSPQSADVPHSMILKRGTTQLPNAVEIEISKNLTFCDRKEAATQLAKHPELHHFSFHQHSEPLQGAGYVLGKAALMFSSATIWDTNWWNDGIRSLMAAKDILERAATVPLNEMLITYKLQCAAQSDPTLKEKLKLIEKCRDLVDDQIDNVKALNEFRECRLKHKPVSKLEPLHGGQLPIYFVLENPQFARFLFEVSDGERVALEDVESYFKLEGEKLSAKPDGDNANPTGAASFRPYSTEVQKRMQNLFSGVKQAMLNFVMAENGFKRMFDTNTCLDSGDQSGKTAFLSVILVDSVPPWAIRAGAAVLEPMFLARHVKYLGPHYFNKYVDFLLEAKDHMTRAMRPNWH